MNQSESPEAQVAAKAVTPETPAFLKGLSLSEISSPSNQEGVVLRTTKIAPPTTEELKQALGVLHRFLDEAGGFRDDLGADDVGITYTLSVHTRDGLIRKVSSSHIAAGLLEKSQLPTALGTLRTTLSLILQPVESSVLDLINRRVDRIH